MRSLLTALLAIPLLVAACGSDGGETGAGPTQPTKSKGKTPSAPTEEPPSDPAPAPIACAPMPKCDAPTTPDVVADKEWTHDSSNAISSGSPTHRGRDAIYTLGEPQWIIGKFAYGLTDKDLKDEEVEVWLERACGSEWEKLGTTRTTQEGAHATVEGVEDTGGRVYFQVPAGKELALGRHRVRLIVAGDRSRADLLIDIVPKNAPVLVSDVDGTLTSSETAEVTALLAGTMPEAQPDAAAVITALAAKGYRPVYLTARPEWLTDRTKEFLAAKGFPPGIVHTTTGLTPALDQAAAEFKSNELVQIKARGLPIQWAFGNKESDTVAYNAVNVQPAKQRIFLQVDDTYGGRRIEKYADVLPDAASALPACK